MPQTETLYFVNCVLSLDIEKIENSDGETKVGNREHLVKTQIVPLAAVYFCVYIVAMYVYCLCTTSCSSCGKTATNCGSSCACVEFVVRRRWWED